MIDNIIIMIYNICKRKKDSTASVDFFLKRRYNRNMETVVCFTGHRPQSFEWDYEDKTCQAHQNYIQKLYAKVGELIQTGYTHFISGGALGADSDFAEAVLLYKESNPNLILEIAIPCETQSKGWSQQNQARYNAILQKADILHVLSPTYTPWCMHARNRYMVDKASAVLAVFNGKESGGTFETLKYAQKKGKITIILPV